MRRALAVAAALLALAALPLLRTPAAKFIQLPPGITEVHREMVLENGVELRGSSSGSVLHVAADFRGRAPIVVRGDHVLLRDFTVDGNRAALEVRTGLPGADVPFSRFTQGNGVLAVGVSRLTIENVRFREVAGFAVLVDRGRQVIIDRVGVEDSGSRNPAGRNNSTGGILLEEGTTDFLVTHCDLRNIRGNGIWTHSLYTSPRNARGVFSENVLQEIGRDALQVGHATDVRVEGNVGRRIGYPLELVDAEGGAIPVGVDTAGDVDHSLYLRNQFFGVEGKCFDLDGFHDGDVRANVCIDIGGYGVVMNNTNPEMHSRNVRIEENFMNRLKYGGVYVIGENNVVARNRLLNLNLAHCGCYFMLGEPDVFRSGIYLGAGAARPALARGNVVEQNEITGYEMAERCVGRSPKVPPAANAVRRNWCE